ncbi:hypothetical protein [Gayadomonas joobiniege]|uniref:hypothetical protein n=1 Tax=Gayadomonas joobiniege TaxID=1234606 RepID=UPI000381DBFF|nr:hypothetical protein [Gayadomonas joobiniege]
MNKIMCVAFPFCLFLTHSVFAQSDIFAAPEMQDFVHVQHFKYSRQQYEDVVISDFYEHARDANEGPDRQLVQFFSALIKDDYQWWLNNWNAETQQDFAQKVALKKGRRSYNYWRATVNKKAVIELKDFVLMGPFALIGSRINSEYHLFPFELEDGRWRLNQAYMSSQVYQQLKTELQR